MGTVARITSDKKLMLAGEIIEREGVLSFDKDGNAKVQEFVEGDKFSYIANGGLTPVIFDEASAMNVAFEGNSVRCTNPAQAWNSSGACSTQTINGDGYAEATAPNSNYKSFALSSSFTNGQAGVGDFCMYPQPGGTLSIREGGVQVFTGATYPNNARLRIAVEGGIVKYYCDGALVYTSTKTPTFPLLVDFAFFNPGASFSDVRITTVSEIKLTVAELIEDAIKGAKPVPIIFDKTLNMIINGNNVTSGPSAADWGTCYATSKQKLLSGDGYVECTIDTAAAVMFCGFSSAFIDGKYADYDHALEIYNNVFYSWHGNGHPEKNLGGLNVGDKLRLEIENGVVKYYQNDVLKDTSTYPPVYPIQVGITILNPGKSLNNIMLKGFQ